MLQYMYHINYQDYEEDLCALEMRALFNRPINDKVFFAEQPITTSISPFIKTRLEVLCEGDSFDAIVQWIKTNEFTAEAFKVQYVPVIKRDPVDKDRKAISRKVGLAITGASEFIQPDTVFGVTSYNGHWYFGVFEMNDILWKQHIEKPYSYSSSLGINTAKAILNTAAKGDLTCKVIDPCCGVGTVLLEGHISGYDITGCEIKEKVAIKARENLKHYGYVGEVINSDIKDIIYTYDAAVVDLPYGNFSHSDEANMTQIIRHAKRISKRQVFISSIDLTDSIIEENLTIVDRGVVYKNKSRRFFRYIWVCEG